MNRARRLMRVFAIEIEQCVRCGGRLKVIASIEEPETDRGARALRVCALVGVHAGAGVVLSTSPYGPRTHWDQIYLPLLGR